MAQISPELSDAIGRLTPGARLDLLRAMVNPEPGRMDRIQRMKERGDTRDVATLLIEIDGDVWARAIVVEILERRRILDGILIWRPRSQRRNLRITVHRGTIRQGSA